MEYKRRFVEDDQLAAYKDEDIEDNDPTGELQEEFRN